jgi:hypothetical protein
LERSSIPTLQNQTKKSFYFYIIFFNFVLISILLLISHFFSCSHLCLGLVFIVVKVFFLIYLFSCFNLHCLLIYAFQSQYNETTKCNIYIHIDFLNFCLFVIVTSLIMYLCYFLINHEQLVHIVHCLKLLQNTF